MMCFVFEDDYKDEEERPDLKEMKRQVIEGKAVEKACEMCDTFNGYYCEMMGGKCKGLVGCIQSEYRGVIREADASPYKEVERI